MISIVIPVYNEEVVVEELFQRTIASLSSFANDFEVICVDDGSTDGTLEKLIRCHEGDKRFKVVCLSRNFGHQPAILAGLNYASGDHIGVMDGDLQDPPELFETFFEKIQEGYDVVYGVRKKRKESLALRIAYWLYYRLLALLSESRIPLDTGDFSLFTRGVRDDMLRMSEHGVFVRGIRSWVGHRQIAIEYERAARERGETKYGLRELKDLALNGMFGFSNVPIKLLGRLGAFIIFLCTVYAGYTIFEKLHLGTTPDGFTSLIIAIVFLTGVQLVSLRVLGEYIVRIYEASKNRPHYFVRKSFLD